MFAQDTPEDVLALALALAVLVLVQGTQVSNSSAQLQQPYVPVAAEAVPAVYTLLQASGTAVDQRIGSEPVLAMVPGTGNLQDEVGVAAPVVVAAGTVFGRFQLKMSHF